MAPSHRNFGVLADPDAAEEGRTEPPELGSRGRAGSGGTYTAAAAGAGAAPLSGNVAEFDTEVYQMPARSAGGGPQAYLAADGSTIQTRRPTRKAALIGGGLAVGLIVLLIGGFLLAQFIGENKKSPQEPQGVDPDGTEGDREQRHQDVRDRGGDGGDGWVAGGAGDSGGDPASADGSFTADCVEGGYTGGCSGPAHTKTSTTTPNRGPTTTSTPGTTTTVEEKCFRFVAQLKINPLQRYDANPDSDAFGIATMRLCTTGNLTATAFLRNGKSIIIATHIHLAIGDGTTDGSDGEGPPIINFCGMNTPGFIETGTDYPEECEDWDRNDDNVGVVKMDDMEGVLIAPFNRGTSLAQRVLHIASNPHMYFFNVHTLASWKQWHPVPKGICRGKLELAA